MLNPPRWRVRRPPPVAALRCCRDDAPTIGAANKICARHYMNAFLAVNAKYFRTSKKCKPISHGNRHEWVCGPTTSERSDWRRHAYPEMAVYEGGFKAKHSTKQPRNRHKEESSTKLTPPTAPPAAPPTPWRPKSPTRPTPWSPSAPRKTKTSPTATPTTNPKTAATAKPTHPPLGRPAS